MKKNHTGLSMKSACEWKLSSDFWVLVSVESDIVWNWDIWLWEESAVLKIDLSNSADIVSGNILVLDFDFQNSWAPWVSWNANVDSFIPDDWCFLFSFYNFSLVLLSSSINVESKDNVVLHWTQNVVAFLEEALSDVKGKSWHAYLKI